MYGTIAAGVLLLAWAGGDIPGAEPPLPQGLDSDDDEPPLPEGLDNDDEPPLPEGLDNDEGPPLPEGLEASPSPVTENDAPAASPRFELPFTWNAFADLRAGTRLFDRGDERRAALGELRFQFQAERSWDTWSTTLAFRGDFIVDPVLEGDDIYREYEVDLETGKGPLDLREASLVASPLDQLDLKLGRQVLTWGTGDLLFINDLFPKDWNAFLIGRDLEYLKAPSDALKASIYVGKTTLDLVYTPRFDADRFPDRRRLSSWDPATQAIAGRSNPVQAQAPERWLQDPEGATRLSRRIGQLEMALYGYRGYWKSPAGFDVSTGEATFPGLSVYGASVRGALWGGIANAEAGYYDSRDDRQGDDAFVRNSELRGLVGYEREAGREFTVSAQYYVEYIRNHQAFRRSLAPGAPVANQRRHLLTMRLQWLRLQQTLRFGVFVYVSPSDEDAYLRPTMSLALTDEWKMGLHGNVFFGRKKHTFFGQLEENSNLGASLRAAW